MNEEKKYSDENKKFATRLYMYSVKAYEYLRSLFTLPCPRTIRRWLGNMNGEPGIFQQAIEYLERKCHENEYQYKECVLMLDGMSIKKNLEWDCVNNCYFGLVDVGNGGEQALGEASEAIVFLAGSLLGNWKIPLGYILTNGIELERNNL